MLPGFRRALSTACSLRSARTGCWARKCLWRSRASAASPTAASTFKAGGGCLRRSRRRPRGRRCRRAETRTPRGGAYRCSDSARPSAGSSGRIMCARWRASCSRCGPSCSSPTRRPMSRSRCWCPSPGSRAAGSSARGSRASPSCSCISRRTLRTRTRIRTPSAAASGTPRWRACWARPSRSAGNAPPPPTLIRPPAAARACGGTAKDCPTGRRLLLARDDDSARQPPENLALVCTGPGRAGCARADRHYSTDVRHGRDDVSLINLYNLPQSMRTRSLRK